MPSGTRSHCSYSQRFSCPCTWREGQLRCIWTSLRLSPGDATVLGDNEFAVMIRWHQLYRCWINPFNQSHALIGMLMLSRRAVTPILHRSKKLRAATCYPRYSLAGRLITILSIDELGMSLEQLRLIDRVYHCLRN